MNRSVPVWALAACLLLAVSAAAEEPPYLEFVRGLRARQLPDYAIQYLEKLRQNPPPGLADILPLEIARVRLDQALLEPDTGQRAARQRQAQADLEAFLQNHPNHPLSAEARLELARIPIQQARAQLNRARRRESKSAQHYALVSTRTQSVAAGQFVRAAAQQIHAHLARLSEPQTPQGQLERQSLTQAKLQAELEQGINLIDQAQTYVDESELLQRGELIKKAAALFHQLASRDSASPMAALARAWLMRCHQENGDPRAARQVYESLLKEEGEHVVAGKRLAACFLLRVIAEDPLKDAATEIRQAAESWLRDYPGYAYTPEGCGVRFELANAYTQLARRQHKQGAPPPAALKLYDEAQKLFHGLEETENDYKFLAREQRLSLLVTVSEERIRGDIHQLPDFECCFLRAQAEVARLARAEKEVTGAKLAGQRKKYLEDMISALNRGLALASAGVPVADLADARSLLAKAYWLAGDPYRAAVLGEEVARMHKDSWRAPLSGACAILAYAQILAGEQRAGSSAAELETERQRLRQLARYVEQTWPEDEAADVARHQRGSLLWSEKKYAEAVEVLAQIHSAYADTTSSLYLLALAARKAHEASVPPPAGKPSYHERALRALESIPEPPPSADAATLQAFVDAKLTLGGLVYSAKQHSRVRELAMDLTKVVAAAESKWDDQTYTEQRLRVLALSLLADYGQAEVDFQAGRYGEASARLDPILTRLKDPTQAVLFSQLKDPRLVHALLALALRAQVQQGNLERGRDILELLQKSAPENALEIQVQLVQQLRSQVQELRQQGQAGRERLEKTTANFAAFLDELGKQQDKLTRPETVLFLAQSYSNLDKHDRAIALLERLAEPVADAAPKNVQLYRAARLLYVRELRLDRRFDQARAVLKGILGTRERPGWGQQQLEAQKERIFLLQDQEAYSGQSGAIAAWNELMTQMQPRVGQDNKLKEQYFECYYQLTYCVFKNALKMSDPKRKREALHRAANLLVQLEISQPDRGGEVPSRLFEDLLQNEPLFKEKYLELKKGSPQR